MRQADLLVEQPPKSEAVAKVKDANTLGLTVAHPILQKADGVIE